jgi:ABC-type multidrug transport system fused ATPase/permease subunit
MRDKAKRIMKAEIMTYIPFIIYSILVIGATKALELIPPRILGKIIDIYIPEKNVKYIFITVIVLVSIPIIITGGNSYYKYQNGKMAKKSSFELKRKMFLNIMRQPLVFFSKNTSGSLASYAGREIVDFIAFWQLDVPSVIVSSVMLIIFLTIMYSISPIIAAVQVLSIPIYVFPVHILGKRLRNNTAKIIEYNSQLNDVISESFKAIRFVKSACIEEQRIGKAENINNNTIKIWGKTIALESMCANWSQGLVTSVFYGITFVMAALRVLDNSITLGELITLMAYLPLFQNTLIGTVDSIIAAQKSLGTHEKSFEYLSLPNEDEQNIRTDILVKKEEYTEYAVVFENISFCYPETSKMVLDNCSFSIKQGEFVGIIGPSGIGKTTIFNLLLKFYNPQEGSIYVQGKNILCQTAQNVRKQIAYVPQDAIMFSGSIRENLKIVNPKATEKQLLQALDKANLLTLIDKLPEGLDTQIGENGFNLSGGEKQRLAIARALLTDCPIILLDEVVANLDKKAEEEIEQTIINLTKEKNITVIAISHKLTILDKASKLIKLCESELNINNN